MVLPQDPTEDGYIEVNYDLTYTHNSISDATKTVEYKNITDRVRLNKTTPGPIFHSGKIITFKLCFYLLGITMDAQLNDWNENEINEEAGISQEEFDQNVSEDDGEGSGT